MIGSPNRLPRDRNSHVTKQSRCAQHEDSHGHWRDKRVGMFVIIYRYCYLGRHGNPRHTDLKSVGMQRL